MYLEDSRTKKIPVRVPFAVAKGILTVENMRKQVDLVKIRLKT